MSIFYVYQIENMFKVMMVEWVELWPYRRKDPAPDLSAGPGSPGLNGSLWRVQRLSFSGQNSNFLPTVRNCNVSHHKKFSSGSQKVLGKCLFINIRTLISRLKFSESVT